MRVHVATSQNKIKDSALLNAPFYVLFWLVVVCAMRWWHKTITNDSNCIFGFVVVIVFFFSLLSFIFLPKMVCCLFNTLFRSSDCFFSLLVFGFVYVQFVIERTDKHIWGFFSFEFLNWNVIGTCLTRVFIPVCVFCMAFNWCAKNRVADCKSWRENGIWRLHVGVTELKVTRK